MKYKNENKIIYLKENLKNAQKFKFIYINKIKS